MPRTKVAVDRERGFPNLVNEPEHFLIGHFVLSVNLVVKN